MLRRFSFPSVLAICATLAVAGCGGEDGTTGRRVVLHTRIQAEGATAPFTTNTGWTVTLNRATIATGPLYYFDGAPALTQRDGGIRRWLAWLNPLATAHAHPGHYVPGNSRGQMLKPAVVDLLGPATSLPDGDGVTGTLRSGTFSFSRPSAEAIGATLAGHSAVTAGTASKDGKTVNFQFEVDLPAIAKTAKDAEIAGCPFTEVDLAGDGTVTVAVIPRIWFNLVDFTELPPGTAAAPTLVPADSTPAIAFALGLAQLSAYHFSLATP